MNQMNTVVVDGETRRRDLLLSIPGFLFVLGAVLVFVLAFVPHYAREPYVHMVIGTLSFAFGYMLLKGTGQPGTLPPADRDLVSKDEMLKSDFVERYRSLRELAGVPGFFRNLDIMGLPLATIAVTILFCLLAILSYVINAFSDKEVIPPQFPSLILELSKLTLGAFIGSFVASSSKAGRTEPPRDSNRSATP